MTETLPTNATITTATLVPHIACRNAAEAAEFYKKAFGAQVPSLLTTADGRVMHGVVMIDGASLYLVDEFPEHGGQSPQSLGGSPVTLHLQVSDCDAVFNRAIEAGCQTIMPLQDMFWGDRYGMIADPYGHKWSISTTVRQVSMEEIQTQLPSMSGCGE